MSLPPPAGHATIKVIGSAGGAELALAPRDLLVVFTDGLVEAEDEKEEQFGEGRMLVILGSRVDGTATQVLQDLMTSADRFVGSAPQHDDITCLVMKMAPN